MKVEISEFIRLFSEVKDANLVNVELGEWVYTDWDRPIINYGAGPCAIIYAFSRKKGKVLSGHFAGPMIWNARDKKYSQELERNENLSDNGIVIPDQETIQLITRFNSQINKSYTGFITELERLNKEEGGVQVVILGQNDILNNFVPEDDDLDEPWSTFEDRCKLHEILLLRAITERNQNRFQFITDLVKAGVQKQSIVDLRPEIVLSNTTPLIDHSLFVPGSGLIFTRSTIPFNG